MKKFLSVFKRNFGAKTIANGIVRVPNLSDANLKLGPHDFVLDGDASSFDISNAGEAIKYIRFNSDTKFPSIDKMPKGFNPTQILENGKVPGLGISKLHDAGITGKNVTIAIIDQALNTEHIEIKDNIIHYESIGYPDTIEASFHGTAVSSLLVGKTLGVAPDAKIVYFAAANVKRKNIIQILRSDKKVQQSIQQILPKDFTFEDLIKGISENKYATDVGFKKTVDDIMQKLPDDVKKRLNTEDTEVIFKNYAMALKKILLMNSRLPKDKKISAVSISWGTLLEDEECRNLMKMLIETGVMVLPTSAGRLYGDQGSFKTIDRKMNENPDDIKSYEPGFWKDFNSQPRDCILVPAGGRTVAGYHSNQDYMYCGADAGMSWATPYLVGVYALAKQISPNLTPQHFFEIAHNTGAQNEVLGHNDVIQPEKIIKYLQNENTLQIKQPEISIQLEK